MIGGKAEAGSHRRDPVIVVGDHNGSNGRNGDPCAAVVVGGPVKVPFAADDEAADLVICADLPAADEYAVVAVEVRQRVRPVVVGPSTANIGADVKTGLAEPLWHRRWRRGSDRQICRSGDRCAKRSKRDACDQCLKFHGVPSFKDSIISVRMEAAKLPLCSVS